MQQADDFLDESMVLAAILEPLNEPDFARETQFKGWTIDDVIGHLYMFNEAATIALGNGVAFDAFFAPIAAQLDTGKTLVQTQYSWLDGLAGRKLFDAWRIGCTRTADNYRDAEPKSRVKWVGPDMSARSAITARQMETWAHGQEVFDVLGIKRVDTDRIRNVAHLGVTTFGWTFANRGEKVPDPAPYVKLIAPSGAIWEWNEPQPANCVKGSATEFCQVVTQVRNIADTSLSTTGPAAIRWMRLAQCFAGPPEDPPAAGMRHVSNSG